MITRTLRKTDVLTSNCYSQQGYYFDSNNNPTIINGLFLLGDYLGYVYFVDAIINIGTWANSKNILFSSIQNGLNNSCAEIYCDHPSNYEVYVATIDSNQNITGMSQINTNYINGTDYDFIEVMYSGIVQAGNQLSSFDPSCVHLLIIPINEQITDYFQGVSFFLDLELTGTIDTARISHRPNKLEYNNEYFNYAGLVINATFKNPVMTLLNVSGDFDLIREGNTIEYSATNNLITLNDYYLPITIHDDVPIILTLGLCHRNCDYGTIVNPAHKYDVFFPDKAPNSLPVVITLHGGSWETGYDENGAPYYCQRNNYQHNVDFLKSCGAIVISAEYRLLIFAGNNYNDPQITTGNVALNHHDMLEDIDSLITSIKYTFANHINISKIYLMGYSSGGHLAMLYAYKSNTSLIHHNIAGVISEAGPIIFNNLPNNTVEKRNVTALLCETTDFNQISPNYYAALNPLDTILIYSDNDMLVNGSYHVSELYNILGDNCYYHVFDSNSGVSHFDLSNTYSLYEDENQTAIDFYDDLRIFIQ
ncbi:carboxylesterase family protein [bacterium]|nr:carboxylesterase family protein [bacterium]